MIDFAVVAWFGATLILFLSRPPRQALVIALVSGWLFLPVYGYPVTGLHAKVEIVATGTLVASLLAARRPWAAFRPSLLDLPALLVTLTPIAASISNGLGAYDAGSNALARFLRWGAPYLLGRVYLSDRRGLQGVAHGLFLGGLAYVPLCLWEIRMSPQLHRQLYGFHQHEFVQTVRWGGFRPMVFMQHGLAVGLWMTLACLAGAWLWYAGGVRRLRGVPVAALLAVLLITTVLLKSVAALILLAVGLAALLAARSLRSGLPLLVLLLVAPAYVTARTTGWWSGREMVEVAGGYDSERGDSLKTRLDNEDDLIQRALERPLFGWGGYGRAEIVDEEGRSRSVRDGQWVIMFGEAGLTGLIAITSLFLLPALAALWCFGGRLWREAALAPAAVATVLLAVVSIDTLLNAFSAPLYVAAAGGLVGLAQRGMLPRTAAWATHLPRLGPAASR